MRPLDPARLRALVRKEAIQIARDPSVYLIAFVLPMLLLFLFGFGISLDATRTRIALVLQDSSGPALRLAQAYQRSPYFATTTLRHMASARDGLVSDRYRAIIVIPPDFGRGVERGRAPDIQIITDGTQPNTANFAAAYGEGVRANWAMQEGLEAPAVQRRNSIEVSARYWFNPDLRSRFFLVPGSIAIVMTMIGTLLTALVVAREWERGTMEAMLATPITMAEFIVSKVVPYFVLALGSMTLCTIMAVFLFGVPLRGSFLALLAVSAAFLMPALGLGLFISAATKNQFLASQIALFSGFLPGFLLSGFLFEIGSMPVALQAISYLVPARYLIPSLQTVFLAGDSWALLLPNILVMLLFGLAFFGLALMKTRRRVG